MSSSDEAARRGAVDPTRSVILQAPAGSGKTTVLIERLLVLLAQAETPEEILAITFTRKAAAEMALRVAQALTADSELARAVRARSAQRGWRLTENPNRLRIQTLDALNRALALQMPLAAGGGGALNVLAEPRTAYRIAARRTLLDAQADVTRRADAQLLFERMENEFARCERLIADMLAKRAHWLPYLVGDAATHLAARVRESLEAVVAARLAYGQQLLGGTLLQEGLSLCAAAAANLKMAAPVAAVTAEALDLPQWQALATLALTKAGGWRKRLTVQEGFPTTAPALKQRAFDWIAAISARRGVWELLDEVRELPDPMLGSDETQVLGVLARLLELAVAELDIVFAELGRIDYPAVAAAARRALGSIDEPSDLALRLDTRIRHILVDEFQDTSLEQTRLLTLLTAGWEPGDGRTLFVVGDPMQSIYGFREAEVGMFLGARATGIGTVPLEALTLLRNFRSAAQIVEWNNTVFARCFPQIDDPRRSAVAYVPSSSARADIVGAVHLHRVLPGDVIGEARSIVRVIASVRGAEPDASIAILVSSRAHAGPIVAALTAAQISVAGVDLVSLQQLSIVRDLTALTQALDHLGDRTAWLAILRAPWCGLTLGAISQIAGASAAADRGATVWERLCEPQLLATLDPDAQARAARLQLTLATSFAEAQHTYASGRESLARRVESTWLRLGGPAACATEADLAHARAFFDALAQWSQEPDWTGPQELPQRLMRLYAAHDPHAGPVVQIMTIHHAKGLEFDHVILPGLGRARRGNDRPLLQWLDLPREARGTDLLMVAVPPVAAAGPTALGRYVTRLQEQRERNEACRLLYVAATRARRHLHLYGQLDAATEQQPQPQPRSGTLLQQLWPAIQDAFPAHAEVSEGTALPQEMSVAPRVTTLARLPADWTLPPLSDGVRPSHVPIASYEPVRAELSTDPVEQAVCEALRSLARRRRLPDRDDVTLAHLAGGAGAALLQACLDDSRLQWIFQCLGMADGAGDVPLALTGMFAGRLTSVRADLSFKDPAGTRWLIDIAPLPLGAPLEAAFELRLAQYQQLAQAFEAGPARAAVYLPARQMFWTGAGS